MTQAVCTIGFGRARFEDTSFSLSAFAMNNEWPGEFPSKAMAARGANQEFPASPYPNINGRLWLNTVEAVDGKILRLMASHFRNGVPFRNAAVFVKLRETGPMYVVNAILPPHRQSELGTNFAQFQGRGDLLSLDDVKGHGIKPPKTWIEGFMSAEEIAKCYDIRELGPELNPRPKVERIVNMSGKEVTIQANQQVRKVRVKR